jgi:hypothetical protein
MASGKLVLSHSFELPEVKEATLKLISDNATHLIKFIYDNQDQEPYNDPLVRVGLAMKTLLKADMESSHLNSTIVDPVIADLLNMIASCKDSRLVPVYTEELRFLKSCTILDDMITLNTTL